MALLLSAMVVCSASAKSKTTRKLKKSTFSQPGIELVTGSKDGNIRAWASGTADSETAARMLAMKNASAELAEMVQKTVESTVNSYLLVEIEGSSASSKEATSKQVQTLASQQLTGATQIFDAWLPVDENGMYKNYIVLELKGDEFIDKLYNDYNNANPDKKLDKKRLDESFEKSLEE